MMASLALGFMAVAWVGFNCTSLYLAPGPLLVRVLLLAFLLALVFFYRWRREQRLVNVLVIVTWSILFGILYALPEYVAARCRFELRDAWLAGLDQALGLEVPAILHFMREHPALDHLLRVCYDLLLVFMTVALMLPPLCGHMGRAKEFCMACLGSTVISLPIFALVPALGPWNHYGYEATPPQAQVERLLLTLRGEEPFTVNLSDLDGIISFPSFHTILALLAAFALWPIRYIRWPAAILAVLIVVSTLTTGWHYVVDILAGLVVTAAACGLARGYTWLESRSLKMCKTRDCT
jgi:hypothetical protein